MMKIIKYAKLLLKCEVLKQQEKKNLRKIGTLQNENETLRQCLLNEEKRTKTFRSSYRKKLNEFEDLERKLKNGKNNIKEK